MEIILTPLQCLLAFCIFFSGLFALCGFGMVVMGLRQIPVSWEARFDKTHPKHERALELYPYIPGPYGDGRITERDPWGAIIIGLIVMAIFIGLICWMIIRVW